MKELSFDEHFEILKQVLQVEPSLKVGEEAEKLISQYGKDFDEKLYKGGYIHEDNLNCIAVKDTCRIRTLAHEMRHAWQFKNKIEEGFCFDKDIGRLRKIKYFISKKELDADNFAFHYCMAVGLKKQAIGCLLNIFILYFFRLVPLIIIIPLIILIFNMS